MRNEGHGARRRIAQLLDDVDETRMLLQSNRWDLDKEKTLSSQLREQLARSVAHEEKTQETLQKVQQDNVAVSDIIPVGNVPSTLS